MADSAGARPGITATSVSTSPACTVALRPDELPTPTPRSMETRAPSLASRAAIARRTRAASGDPVGCGAADTRRTVSIARPAEKVVADAVHETTAGDRIASQASTSATRIMRPAGSEVVGRDKIIA